MIENQNPEGGVAIDEQRLKELDDLLQQGEDLLDEKNYEAAIQHQIRLIQQFPESPLPHHGLAVVYLAMLREDYSHLDVWEDLGDDESLFELAVGEEEASLDIDKDFFPALNNLGTLFALRGWWRNAMDQWEASLSISPDQPSIREDLTNAHSRLG